MWQRREMPAYIDGLSYTNQLDVNMATDQTRTVIDALLLKQVQQVRLMHIALGCLSMSLALWVVIRVYWDSWRSHKLQPRSRSSLAFLYELHEAEIFPLILGYTVFFQELIMVMLQSMSLQEIMITSCNVTSTVIFPTIFALSYMHFVFGAAMTIRALKRFPSRGHYQHSTAVCLLTFAALIIITAIPTRIMSAHGQCFGDLLLRPLESKQIGLGIVSFLLLSFIIMAAVIGRQLVKHKNVNAAERIAGTRMFYYLIISACLQAFLLPFFIQAVSGTFDQSLTSSRIAEFVLFASGAIVAIIHLVLRANSARFAIKPPNTRWQKKRRFRLTGPNDLEILNISPPLNLMNETFGTYRKDEKYDEAALRAMREGYVRSRESLYQQPDRSSRRISRAGVPRWPLPQRNRVSTIHEASEISPASIAARKMSAEKFPEDIKIAPIQLPAVAYTPLTKSRATFERSRVQQEPIVPTAPLKVVDKPLPPRKQSIPRRKHSRSDSNDSVTVVSEAFEELHLPSQPWMVEGTRRPSSTDSSRTVQIGIIMSSDPSAATSVVDASSSSSQTGSQVPTPAPAPTPPPTSSPPQQPINPFKPQPPLPLPSSTTDTSPQAQFKNYDITSATSTRPPRSTPFAMRRSHSDVGTGAGATHHSRQYSSSDTRPPYLRAETDIRASNDLWPVGPKNEDFRFSRFSQQSVAQYGMAEVVMLNPINALDRSKSRRLYKPPSFGLKRSGSVHAWF